MAYVEGVKAEGEANPLVFHCTLGSGRVSHRSGSGWLNTLCAKPTEWSSFFTGTVHMLSKFVKFSFHIRRENGREKLYTRRGTSCHRELPSADQRDPRNQPIYCMSSKVKALAKEQKQLFADRHLSRLQKLVRATDKANDKAKQYMNGKNARDINSAIALATAAAEAEKALRSYLLLLSPAEIPHVQAVFDSMDLNHDSVYSVFEIHTGLTRLGLQVDVKKMAGVFAIAADKGNFDVDDIDEKGDFRMDAKGFFDIYWAALELELRSLNELADLRAALNFFLRTLRNKDNFFASAMNEDECASCATVLAVFLRVHQETFAGTPELLPMLQELGFSTESASEAAAEMERLARMEAERLAAEHAEQRAEEERRAAEMAERLTAEAAAKAELDRLAAEKAEADRLEAENAEAVRLEGEKMTAARFGLAEEAKRKATLENARKEMKTAGGRDLGPPTRGTIMVGAEYTGSATLFGWRLEIKVGWNLPTPAFMASQASKASKWLSTGAHNKVPYDMPYDQVQEQAKHGTKLAPLQKLILEADVANKKAAAALSDAVRKPKVVAAAAAAAAQADEVVMSHLLSLSKTVLELELRGLIRASGLNERLAEFRICLGFYGRALSTHREYDKMQALLGVFLRLHKEAFKQAPELLTDLKELREIQRKHTLVHKSLMSMKSVAIASAFEKWRKNYLEDKEEIQSL